MAEPTNTPMPTAPPTRSSSPAPPLPTSTPLSTSPITARISHWTQSYLHSQPHLRLPTVIQPLHTPASKPIVLYLGDAAAAQTNTETYTELTSHYEIIRPSPEDRTRPAFTAALRAKKWGDFAAILQTTGAEMGNWDAELIALLPDSMRVFASTSTASHDGDRTNVKSFGEKGILYTDAVLAAADATADFAVAQIISTFQALPHCIASASATQSTTSTRETRSSLRGHVLGLVGFGDVGRLIAQRCAAFGMRIQYFDDDDDAKRSSTVVVVGGSPRAKSVGSLEALVRASDCVVLCDSVGVGRVFDRECLRWVKKGARLVAVASALVDEDALAEALEAGSLAGVALDVSPSGVGERLAKFVGSTALLTCCSDAETGGGGVEEVCMRSVLGALGGEGSA